MTAPYKYQLCGNCEHYYPEMNGMKFGYWDVTLYNLCTYETVHQCPVGITSGSCEHYEPATLQHLHETRAHFLRLIDTITEKK